MKINKLTALAAAAIALGTMGARADDDWRTSHRHDTDPNLVFNCNELSLDVFGEYGYAQRHFLAWPNTTIHKGHYGGGVGFNYFFTRELGIGVDAAALAGSPRFIDHAGANLIARIPIDAIHLAPYVFGGGGVMFNGIGDAQPVSTMFADVGAGLEFRFTPKAGIFADARYIWRNTGTSDEAALRAGVRLLF